MRAPNRLVAVQRFCVEQLKRRGLPAELEVPVSGAYRDKVWDVAYCPDGEVRLAVSCRSVLCDHSGAGANRLDDLLGEAVNIHRRWPKAVLGYFLVVGQVDHSVAARRRRASHNDRDFRRDIEICDRWFATHGEVIGRLAQRSSPRGHHEHWEGACLLQVAYHRANLLLPVRSHPGAFSPYTVFDRLAYTYHRRFPEDVRGR